MKQVIAWDYLLAPPTQTTFTPEEWDKVRFTTLKNGELRYRNAVIQFITQPIVKTTISPQQATQPVKKKGCGCS